MMIFEFLPQNSKTQAVAVGLSMAWPGDAIQGRCDEGRACGVLAAFRGELYRCFAQRADELFELSNALLCAGAPVRVLAELSLVSGHRRGHGRCMTR
jgi:hypothetical protein